MRMWSVLRMGVRVLRSPTPARCTVRVGAPLHDRDRAHGTLAHGHEPLQLAVELRSWAGGGAGAGRAGEQRDQGDQSSADHGERC